MARDLSARELEYLKKRGGIPKKFEVLDSLFDIPELKRPERAQLALTGLDAARFVTGLRDAKRQVRAAGIDLTADKIMTARVPEENPFRDFIGKIIGYMPVPKPVLSFDDGLLPKYREIKLSFQASEKSFWSLAPGPYLVRFAETVSLPDVPPFYRARIYPRMTLLQCGCDLQCGTWKSGYSGQGTGLLIIHNPDGLILEHRARIGRIEIYPASGSVEEGGKTENGKRIE